VVERGKIMPMCCVCGKEAEYLYHGMWWCKSHKPREEEDTSKSPGKINREAKQPSNNLELKWV